MLRAGIAKIALLPVFSTVIMKTLMTLSGAAALAAGLLFVGQGLGYIRWPASSFMINETAWVYYGGAIAAAGLTLIIVARR